MDAIRFIYNNSLFAEDDWIARYFSDERMIIKPDIQDIAETLSRLHGEPIAWLLGQYKKYLLRFQPSFVEDIENVARKLNFTEGSIVGYVVQEYDPE